MDQERQREKEREKAKLRQIFVIAGVTLFTSCCIILFYFCVKRYEGLGQGWDKFVGVWQAIIIGFVLAFLMNPFMEFFEKNDFFTDFPGDCGGNRCPDSGCHFTGADKNH